MLGAEAAEVLKDPVKSARGAGLHYVTDDCPGIRRERRGSGFQYRRPSGKIVHDPRTLRRIRSLVVPPAWSEVWICADPEGHLQATGRDERRRKQFRYHPRWREIRDETKFARLITFAEALRSIRRRVRKDLALSGVPRKKVLAAIVRLLELSLIRVGNDEYARENESFGLTTLRDRHVNVSGARLRFRFRGKSGKHHEVDVRDRRLAKIVKNCQDLPGQELFQFMENGERHDVRSEDVNEYLREISGEDFTAKDFRTWAGTVLAARALRDREGFESRAEAKRNVTAAVESVAARLGNTPAVCRKCYIHPHMLDAYRDGTLARALGERAGKVSADAGRDLRRDEADVLKLLRRRISLGERLSQSIKRETAARSRARRRRASRPRSAPAK